jgi:hypothetical protein
MKRMLSALALGLLLAPAAALAATPPKAGTYEVGYVTPTAGPIACLVKITPKDDGVEGEIVATVPALRGLELKSVTLDGDVLKVVLKRAAGDMTFEGRVPKAGADTILGTFEMGPQLMMGRMAATDKTELTPANSTFRPTLPEPMRKAQALQTKAPQLRARAQQAQDAEEKAKLQKEVAEAVKEAQTELPKLYREVIEKHADSSAAVLAAQTLLRQAGRDKIDAAEAGRLAAVILKGAAPYGPRYEKEVTVQVAEMLGSQAPFAALALEYAQRAEKGLTAQDSVRQQIRVLGVLAAAQKKAGQAAAAVQTTARQGQLELDQALAAEKALTEKDTPENRANVLSTLAAALRKTGKTDDAARTEATLAKINDELDRDYLAKMPPFKPTTFEGRKAQSDRVAVMELFTGAECPPCVAADLAFDALLKTYKPSDVVLIQYHMHIPGPDPMTNPATEARWAYYREKFEGQVGGVPSSLFNGKPQGGGGGGAPQSQAKYKQYRGIIDELLEKPSAASVTVGASQLNDTITVQADVIKLAAPGENVKLRLLLVEETIRFVGGNRIRFHHQVVRAMPGGFEGKALTEKETRHTATIKLGDLREELTKYLDTYAAEQRPFPRADRPMAFKNLKVIALVQDDKTGEIFQAAQADVTGARAAR